jgi:hypothetical protein
LAFEEAAKLVEESNDWDKDRIAAAIREKAK